MAFGHIELSQPKADNFVNDNGQLRESCGSAQRGNGYFDKPHLFCFHEIDCNSSSMIAIRITANEM